jgi:hypothetical protein
MAQWEERTNSLVKLSSDICTSAIPAVTPFYGSLNMNANLASPPAKPATEDTESKGTELLLYGCNVVKGEGAAFVEKRARIHRRNCSRLH